MDRYKLWVISFAAMAGSLAHAQGASTLDAIRAACAADAQKLCAGVQPGGGRIIACLKEHKDALSDQCKQAAAQAANPRNNSGIGGPGTAPSGTTGANDVQTKVPAATTDAPSAPGSAANLPTKASPAKPSHSAGVKAGVATSKDAPGSYLRLKQVQIVAHIDNGVDIPAVDMLIPSDWTFKGTIASNVTDGCFIDMFVTLWDAASADGTIHYSTAPNFSWQYADDPGEVRKLTDPARRALGGNGKPCPVSKPQSAESLFRQRVVPTLKNTDTVVAIEPFPELEHIARRQMGLPADQASDRSGTRVDAIRARLDFGKDGHPEEGWATMVVVTRILRQGRGAFYDCHAIDLFALRTPKGKLDANDKLFKVMISSLRMEPKWQSYAGGTIAKLYQAEAQKEAVIDQTIANLQNYAAQTIMAVTANQMRGSNNAAFAADQNIRGVQTFRDPTTGQTMELSNLYDHAWLNGSNEYIMSEDPNFNPNSQLTGQWSQLQVVRPAP